MVSPRSFSVSQHSRLPSSKTWDNFQWTRLPLAVARQLESLRDGAFLDRRENLLLFLGKDIAPRQFTASRGSPLDAGATLLQLLDPSIDAIGFGRSLLAA